MLGRSIRHSVLKTLRLLRQQDELTATARIGLVDGQHLPITKQKAYPLGQRKHTPEQLDTIVVHVTGVSQGFGVSSRQVSAWERKGGHPEYPGLEPEELALLARYRDTPYHHLVSWGGISFSNRDLEQWTWHANRGNYGVGIAFDCDWDDLLTDRHCRQFQIGLHDLAFRVRAWTGKRRLKVVAHRQFSRSRAVDPGPRIWRSVVLPWVKADGDVSVHWKLAMGSGQQIPNGGKW